MGLIELMAVAAGLSMDAFAVALCKGACLREKKGTEGILIALSFGFFQALMPLLGWLLGTGFSAYIQAFDHFVAFGLLAFIGIKLIREALKPDGDAEACTPLRFGELMMLSLATSIDALAAGIAFAMLEIRILEAVGLIGLITFALSLLAVSIGRRFGARYQAKAQLAGGICLIVIGAKVLLDHLTA